MNLELLKKLTRLANNNPNEHEANLAARKVCRMLADSNWALSPPTPQAPPIPKPKSAQTWNDVRRSTEPEFSSKWRSARSYRPFDEYYRPSTSERQRGFYSRDYDIPPNEPKKDPPDNYIVYNLYTDSYTLPDGHTVSGKYFHDNYDKYRGIRIVYKS